MPEKIRESAEELHGRLGGLVFQAERMVIDISGNSSQIRAPVPCGSEEFLKTPDLVGQIFGTEVQVAGLQHLEHGMTSSRYRAMWSPGLVAPTWLRWPDVCG